MIRKTTSYLEDVVKEMRKVSWPSRNEMFTNTAITLFASAAVSLFIYMADQVISTILEFIYR